MEIKKIIITGDEGELNFITRLLCGIHCLTINSGYRNSKKEGLMFLETRVSSQITGKVMK